MGTELVIFRARGITDREARSAFVQYVCQDDLGKQADVDVLFRGYQDAISTDVPVNFPLDLAKRCLARDFTFLKRGRTLAVTGWHRIIPVR